MIRNKNMKIKKEFIEQIIQRKKIYEYRIVDKEWQEEHEGIYKINGSTFLLRYLYSFEDFNELASHCIENEEWESLKFILNQGWDKENFLDKGQEIALLKWELKFEKDLEIVE